MIRLPLYLNIFMATLTIAAAIYTITIKSQIAVDQRASARLVSQINAEKAMGEVLRAEWARLQRRDTIEALGVSRFGPAVAQTPQEINVRNLTTRADAGNGRAQARDLFQAAIAALPRTPLQTGITGTPYDPANHLITAADPIAACLKGAPCPWVQGP